MKITTQPVNTPKAFKPFQLVIEIESLEEAERIRRYFEVAVDRVIHTNTNSFFKQLHDKMVTAIQEATK